MQRFAAIAAVLLFAAPALALDLPARKPGLWELKMTIEANKRPSHLASQLTKHCTDASTDKLMNKNFGGSSEQSCSKQDMKTSGNTIVIDSVCNYSGMTVTSHSVVTGSFDSAYTVDVTATRSGKPPAPGMAADGSSHMVIDAKYLGPCAAGQRPGDVIMSNGMTVNVLDMQKRMGPRPQ